MLKMREERLTKLSVRMKNRGLRHRFSDEVRSVWLYWNECIVCGFNGWDVLHHIMSSTSSNYIDGKHNESVYNSCPIHNYVHPNQRELYQRGARGFGVTESCHIGNETWLHKNEADLLRRVKDSLDFMGYEPNALDEEFLRVYSHLYEVV